jgi:hypothetical protein
MLTPRMGASCCIEGAKEQHSCRPVGRGIFVAVGRPGLMSIASSTIRWPFAAALVALTLWPSQSLAQTAADDSRPDRVETPPPIVPPTNGEDQDIDTRPAKRVLFAAEGSYTAATVFGVPITGADVSAMLGAQGPTIAYGLILDLFSGSTEGGLSAIATDAGPFAEGRFGRLRLGGGLRVGLFNANRVTSSAALLTLSAGIFARATVDIIDFDRTGNGAFYLVLKGSADAIGGPLLAASGGLGVRF